MFTPQLVPIFGLFLQLSMIQCMNRLILYVRLRTDYLSTASRNIHNRHRLHPRNIISCQKSEERDMKFLSRWRLRKFAETVQSLASQCFEAQEL